MHWRAPLCISKRAELDVAVVRDVELEIESKYVFWQKQVLIDAIELWLSNPVEKSCGNLNCLEYQ